MTADVVIDLHDEAAVESFLPASPKPNPRKSAATNSRRKVQQPTVETGRRRRPSRDYSPESKVLHSTVSWRGNGNSAQR